ncbi:MAG: short chain dehydrogenase [Burkholderiales bacterium RIFCSPLOWO2_02_FULL_57_36]|nr:MAG: short chain dehydrogenase [Burkholderiales bacterium RIFCSPLOWO2_02_FULL_57_36]
MSTALIIGASRGIGRELTRQLLAAGWQVFATARDDATVAALQAEGAAALNIDVTKPEALAALGWKLDDVKLDLAVYVAGVSGPRAGSSAPPTAAEFDAVMHANVLGAMQSVPLIAPLVEAAAGKFIFISSIMGSIAETQGSSVWTYRTSKAALNMAVKAAAFDYPKATMVVMHPGWVRTDMGGPNASISVQESVDGMRRVIETLSIKDSGTFWNQAGEKLPW